MCGRYTLRTSSTQLAENFQLLREHPLQPRYNIAPTQPVAAVRLAGSSRELSLLHWGLIPSWSKELKTGARMINARAETVATKPSFRSAFRRRRCLILADGYYEWKKTGGPKKQPVYISMQDGQPFAFTGLWEHWKGADSTEIESCTIITTEANDLLGEIHDRMPVILPEQDYDRWLDPKPQDNDELQRLLVPCTSDEMTFYPVGTAVNNARNEIPACIVPQRDYR